MLSRRDLLRYALTGLAAEMFGRVRYAQAVAQAQGSYKVIAGAIRWDSWYRKVDKSVFAQNGLSPARYRYRAPVHCTVAADSLLNCTGSQMVMDAEIEAAARAGLEYWAFDWYQPGDSLRVGWELYQSSAKKHLIKWCAIAGLHWLGSSPFTSGEWRTRIKEWIEHMRQPNYQKVAVGAEPNRPLLYVIWEEEQVRWHFANNLANVRMVVDALRNESLAAGIGAPYLVILHNARAPDLIRSGIADAVSNYKSVFKRETRAPYSHLDQATRDYWRWMAREGVPFIPIAMIGWDLRSREEFPLPWDKGKAPIRDPKEYFEIATPREFAEHLRAAVQFIQDNPAACPSRALLIYSWSECEEGGCMMPTLGHPKGDYLSAIAPVLS